MWYYKNMPAPANDPRDSLTAALAIGGDGTEDTRGKQIKQIYANAKGGDTVTVSLYQSTIRRERRY